jgi:hypothetical protein
MLTDVLFIDHTKTTSQSVSDHLGRSKDEAVHGGSSNSIGDKVKHGLGLDKRHV